MKKSLALILGLCIFLSACTAGIPTKTIGDPTTPPTSSQTTATTAPAETGGTDETVEPSKPDSTQPSDSSEPTEATHSAATVPSDKEDADTPKQTEPKETEPPVNPSQPTTPPETHPEETEQPTTQPTATDPTTPQKTIAELTESTTEPVALDFDAAEDYGTVYGVNKYQWVVDPSLTMNNAGFNFPDTVSMAGLQENGGQEYLNRLVKEEVDSLYTTLSLYGSPEGCRINCHIEFMDSDTIAIYILYG